MTPTDRKLQVILEAFLQAKTDQFIGTGYWKIQRENRKKTRGEYLLKSGRTKEGRVEEELKTDSQEVDELRVPVEMWDMRAWAYEEERESGDLNILWESMLRWWRRKLKREFSQFLRRISGIWKWVGLSQGIREVAGEYVCIEEARW